jgi:hypothetical protein
MKVQKGWKETTQMGLKVTTQINLKVKMRWKGCSESVKIQKD